MTLRAVFLDSGPMGLVTQRSRKSADVDACKAWVTALDLVTEWIIATGNVAHLSHYAPADIWQNITP